MITKAESRTPGIVNAIMALLLLAVIIPLALIASQQPPPAIAEFAPQDQQQIKKAPNSQAAGEGRSQADLLGQSLPSPSPSSAILGGLLPTPSPIDTARVRRCVGDPPPSDRGPPVTPCVPYFTGSNGGSTYSHGVSGTSINILYDYGFDQWVRSSRLAPLRGKTIVEIGPTLSALQSIRFRCQAEPHGEQGECTEWSCMSVSAGIMSSRAGASGVWPKSTAVTGGRCARR